MKLTELAAEQKAALAARVLQLREEGVSCARVAIDAPASLGFEGLVLNHTQVDWITYEARITPADEAQWTGFATTERGAELISGGATELAARVVLGREAGLSWGWMAVLNTVTGGTHTPEGRIRAAYATVTANKSQGQRIGKGGRFYYRDGELYEDNLKPTGTVIPVGTDHAGAKVLSYKQRIERLTPDGVKNMGAAKGVTMNKGERYTAFLRRVLVAYGLADAPAPAKKAKAPKAPKLEAPVAEAPVYGPELPEAEEEAAS